MKHIRQHPLPTLKSAIILCSALAFITPSFASEDWTQWRGPDRSNVSEATGLLKEWPSNGPPLIWEASGLGTGIASVSVSEGVLFTTGYRDDNEFIYALDATTGEGRWAKRIGPTVRESSLMRWLSQRTPTVDGDRIYILAAGGDLYCLQAGDGRTLWQLSYPKDFLSQRPVWGYCDYPLVDGEKLVCVPLGPEAKVVALDKESGELIWKSSVRNSGRAGYAATVISEACGIRQYIVFLESGLMGIAADDGRLLWRHPRPPVRIAASYTPMVHGDYVVSLNGYGGGMTLLQLIPEGEGIIAQEVYHNKFNFNPFQDATAKIDEHVYAFQMRGAPVCIEWKTGELAWGPIQMAIRGRAELTAAEGRLYARGANGLMVLVKATPEGYVEMGSFNIPDPEEASGVTSPVVAGGRLYLRDNDRLLCYDISAANAGGPRAEPRTIALSWPNDGALSQQTSETQPQSGLDRAPDAIYVPTPDDVVDKMLELAGVTKEDLVYDLGSGDGRIVMAAAKTYGCKAVGVEIDRDLVERSREKIKKSRFGSLIKIEHADLFTIDLSEADVIAVYLPSPLLERLIPQLQKLKPGARIVSHQFRIPGIRPDERVSMTSAEDGDQHSLFLWTAPLKPSR